MIRDAALNALVGVRRLATTLLLATLTTQACTYYEAQQRPVTQVLQVSHPSTLRVTTTAGSVWLLDRPRISGDTLQGRDGDAAIFIPVGEVAKVDIQRFAPGRTLFLGFGTALIASAVDFVCCTKFYPLGKAK
jgi:hypothetical protein